jgi:hypothetical protein
MTNLLVRSGPRDGRSEGSEHTLRPCHRAWWTERARSCGNEVGPATRTPAGGHRSPPPGSEPPARPLRAGVPHPHRAGVPGVLQVRPRVGEERGGDVLVQERDAPPEPSAGRLASGSSVPARNSSRRRGGHRVGGAAAGTRRPVLGKCDRRLLVHVSRMTRYGDDRRRAPGTDPRADRSGRDDRHGIRTPRSGRTSAGAH